MPSLPAQLTHRVTSKEPSVYNPPLGPSLVGASISIEEFLRNRLHDELFDGPLTDYEHSDLEEEDAPAKTTPAHSATLSSTHTSSIQTHSPPLPTGHSKTAQKQKKRAADRRRRKRADVQAAENTNLKQVTKKRRVEATRDALKLHFDMGEDIRVTRPGWIGKRVSDLPRREFTKEELVNELGMTAFPWNGRTTHLLLDNENHIIGVLLGQPRDSADWKGVHDAAYRALKHASSAMVFSDKETSHRRGAFPAVAHGISFGGGQEEPKHLDHGSGSKDRILDELMQEKSIQRICKFASSGFEMYSKRNYDYMKETMEKLRTHYDSASPECRRLRRPYDSDIGVFPCRSLNLGEQSISFPHTDEGNLAQSWCSITPVGYYNPVKGGHIVLWDFGLVIEFPPGATILIPSALIRHSNTSISPGESRFSIIQYASGGLYRWVHHGFMSEARWKAQASSEDLRKEKCEQEMRWKNAVDMFTRLEDLIPKPCPSPQPQLST